jgi:hypothetical protein
VTQRDRYVLIGLAVLALLGAYWFLALAPKRDSLSKLDEQVQTSEQSVQSARQEAQQFARARLQFPTSYATLVRLGKAVPADPDVPSLIVQLDRAAKQAGVDFRKLELQEDTGSSGSTSAPPPAPSAGASASSASTPGAGAQSGGAAQGTTGASGAQSGSGAPSASGGPSAPQSSMSSASSSTSSAAGTPGAAAPPAGTTSANAVAAAGLPIGAVVGPAQLPVMRFNFTFQGSFFKMADFIHNIRQLVQRRDRRLQVSGRLLTIEAITFAEGDFSFPQIKASIAATSYLVPSTQGLLAGATPQGPGGATAATPAPASSPGGGAAPPAAVVRKP